MYSDILDYLVRVSTHYFLKLSNEFKRMKWRNPIIMVGYNNGRKILHGLRTFRGKAYTLNSVLTGQQKDRWILFLYILGSIDVMNRREFDKVVKMLLLIRTSIVRTPC